MIFDESDMKKVVGDAVNILPSTSIDGEESGLYTPVGYMEYIIFCVAIVNKRNKEIVFVGENGSTQPYSYWFNSGNLAYCEYIRYVKKANGSSGIIRELSYRDQGRVFWHAPGDMI